MPKYKLPMIPQKYCVLVRQKPIEKVTSGGIVIAQGSETKREQAGTDKGVIMAMGPIAFKHEDFNGWKPDIGDEIVFSRHAGKRFQTEDDKEGVFWHLMNDEDIAAVIPKENTFVEVE